MSLGRRRIRKSRFYIGMSGMRPLKKMSQIQLGGGNPGVEVLFDEPEFELMIPSEGKKERK